MGLDEFMDIDSDDSESSTNDSDDEELTDREGITEYESGDVGPRGPIGYEDFNEYRDTISGSIDTHGDLFKYKLPIFPHIELQNKYHQTRRYKLKEEMQDVSCVSSSKTRLGKLSRELIMLDTGETDKEKCLDVLEDRFGERPNPNTEVYLFIFSKVKHIAKMAIADEITDSWSSTDKDGLIKAIYNDSYTQQFSQIDSDDYEHKRWNHIEEW